MKPINKQIIHADWLKIILKLRGAPLMNMKRLAQCVGCSPYRLYGITRRRVRVPEPSIQVALWNILTIQIGHDQAQNYLSNGDNL